MSTVEPSQEPTAPSVGARVCPRCGTPHPPLPRGEGPVERCAKDGFALVLQSELEAACGDVMLGRLVAGRFTVVARLGSGSMGAVYRSWQETVGRWVALKIMRYDRTRDSETRARFEREARAMSQLVSPNTVTVFDFGQAEDGSVFLAMELLEGESLGMRLKRSPRLPVPEAIHITRQALTSLAEAHDKGIIHRDIKPDNLFLARTPDVGRRGGEEICKILDFGIAKVIRGEAHIDALETQAGTVFGTPRYMSPEQAQGKPLDPRSDLYSLGVILYQMVTGRVPFDDEEAVVVMARHIKTKPKPPREVARDAGIPSELERVILRALAKEPDDRPDSSETFLRALEVAERSFVPSIPSTPPAARTGDVAMVSDDPLPTLAPSELRRRRKLARWGLGLGVAVTVVLAILVARRVRVAPSPTGVETARPAIAITIPPSDVSFTPAVSASASAPPSATASSVPIEALPVAGDPASRPAAGRGRWKPPKRPKHPAAGTTTAPAPTPAPTSTKPTKYEKWD